MPQGGSRVEGPAETSVGDHRGMKSSPLSAPYSTWNDWIMVEKPACKDGSVAASLNEAITA